MTICQEDHDQILADPNATTDELREIIKELQAELAAPLPDEVAQMVEQLRTLDVQTQERVFKTSRKAADLIERLAKVKP